MHDDDLPADSEPNTPATTPPEESSGEYLDSTPATTMLANAGIPYALHTVIPQPNESGAEGEGERENMSAAEKANCLGIDPRRLFKTVIVSTGHDLVSATLPALSELDLPSLAAAVGTRSATLADPDASAEVSGYEAQQTSPLGMATEIPSVIDVTAMAFPSILFESGVAGLTLEVMPMYLLELLRARTAPIATL